MTKKSKKSAPQIIKKLILPDDEPIHLDMTFEEAIKRAVNTPIEKSKGKRK